MERKAAINYARFGAQKIWAGTVSIKPDAKTGAHHHGELESVKMLVPNGRTQGAPRRTDRISWLSRARNCNLLGFLRLNERSAPLGHC